MFVSNMQLPFKFDWKGSLWGVRVAIEMKCDTVMHIITPIKNRVMKYNILYPSLAKTTTRGSKLGHQPLVTFSLPCIDSIAPSDSSPAIDNISLLFVNFW
jgi:hypothetical protein